MTPRIDPRLAELLRRFAAGTAVVIVFAGGLVLVGWAFDFGILKGVSLGLVTMKANAALSFILAGLSLWLIPAVRGGQESHANILTSRFCAAGVLGIGGLTLSQDIGDLNFGIDQLLFPDTEPVDTSNPGRMSPVTALNFMLVGAGLLLLRTETRRGFRPTEVLVIPMIIISLLTLIGYLYDFRPLYKFGPHSAMAVHTAGAFVLLGTAVLASCQDRGLMALFTRNYPGGSLLRRLLPVAIVVPIALGWVGLKSAYQGFFNPELEVTAIVTVTIVLSLWCAWNMAGFVDKAHIERKEAEEASVLQALLDAAPDATVTVDVSGNILKMNKQAETLFGYRATELTGRPVGILIPERFHQRHENRQIMDQADQGVWAIGAGSNLILHQKDGREVFLEICRSPAHLGDGQRVTIVAIRDVTQRTRVAEALASSEMQMRLFMEATTDCIWNWDLKTGHVERSVGFQRRFGYAEEEIVPSIDWWSERLYPDDRNRVRAFYENAIASGSTCSYEYRFRCRDGSYATVSDRAFIIRDDTGMPIRALGAMTDITERVRAEEALRESREEFTSAFRDASIGMALVETDGKWRQVNRALCDIVGYTEQELLATNFQAITHPDDLETDLGYVKRLLAGEIPNYHMEKRYIHKLGDIVWIQLDVSLVHDSQGRPDYFVGQIQNVTDRKRVEAELRDSRERLEAILNNSPTLIFLKDLEGRYLLVNREFEKVFHLTRQDILGKTDADIFSPPQATLFRANDIKVLQANAPMQCEEMALHDDGQHTSIVFKFPLRDGTGIPYAIGGIATDITHRKQMEQALRQSEEELRQLLEEREHLSRDLHDNIIQTLCVVGMGIEESLHVLQEDPSAAKHQLVHAIAGLNGVIRDVRSHLTRERFDAPSNVEYVQRELAWLIQTVKNVQGPQLYMTVKESALTELPEEVTRHVIAITREAVSNCLKHAGASSISVSLQEHGSALRLAIEDDGVGFDTEKSLRSDSHGLRNIAARTQQIGGTLQVISQPMQGTHILVHFPGGKSYVLV